MSLKTLEPRLENSRDVEEVTIHSIKGDKVRIWIDTAQLTDMPGEYSLAQLRKDLGKDYKGSINEGMRFKVVYYNGKRTTEVIN
jgi:translation elongation factor P/translation initiation factor 5A